MEESTEECNPELPEDSSSNSNPEPVVEESPEVTGNPEPLVEDRGTSAVESRTSPEIKDESEIVGSVGDDGESPTG